MNTYQNQVPTKQVVQRLVSDLKPDPKNARLHDARQINMLAKSINAFGFNVPVLIDAESNVLAGHGRLLACQKLGIQEVPTISLAHLSPEQAKAFMLADNRLTEFAKWDDKLLAVQLKELSLVNLDFELEATGFSIGEIDLRIEGLNDDSIDETEPEIPVAKGPVVTQLADLWLMGQHRLYCGNSQDPKSYEYLMQGQKAGMVITDPPYNVKVQGHVGGKGKIKHAEFVMASGEMSQTEFTDFLQNTFDLLVKYSQQGSVHTIFMSWHKLSEIIEAGKASYSAMLNMCVWVKNQGGMGSLYRSQHELALIYRNGNTPHQNNVQLGRFGRYRTNVWQYGGIQTMRHGEEGDLLKIHPTVKPIQMIADAILDVSKPNDIILDPFLGSGTALLAAERVGRRCYAMELDPAYVDTAIRRWQMMTGRDAINAETGLTFTAQSEKNLEVNHG
jgi:DNA modification methylase